MGVIIEARARTRRDAQADDLRCKALNELLLYYLRERIGRRTSR